MQDHINVALLAFCTIVTFSYSTCLIGVGWV